MGEIAHGLLGELNLGPAILIPKSTLLFPSAEPSLSAVPTCSSCHFLTIVTQTPPGNLITASPLNVSWLFVEQWQDWWRWVGAVLRLMTSQGRNETEENRPKATHLRVGVN